MDGPKEKNQGSEPKKKRSAYVTSVQKELLIDFVTSNFRISFGREPDRAGDRTKDELWTEISAELNEMGAVKDVSGWKRCYAAIKSSTNRKVKKGGSGASKMLNSLEAKIVTASQSVTSNVDLTSTASQGESQSTVTKSLGTYSTAEQRQLLAKLVGDNYDALFGKLSNSSNGDLIKKKVWKLIAYQLNSNGPEKDVEGWIRCYNGLKGSTKEKLNVIRQNRNRKNNEKDIELVGIDSDMFKMHPPGTLDGCQEIDELGFGRHMVRLNTTSENDTESVQISDSREVDRTSDCADLIFDTKQFNEKGHELDQRLEVLNEKLKKIVEPSIVDQLMESDAFEEVPPPQETGDIAMDIDKDCSLDQEMNATLIQDIGSEDDGWTLLQNVDLLTLSDEDQIGLLMRIPSVTTEDLPEENLNTSVFTLSDAIGTTDVGLTDGKSDTSTTVQTDRNVNRSKVTVLEDVVICGPNNSDTERPTTSGLAKEPTNTVNAEIPSAPIQQPPQRRGVEINLNKYVKARKATDDGGREPRRIRLSTPLGVMAEQALDEQKITNVLLADILSELRNHLNH